MQIVLSAIEKKKRNRRNKQHRKWGEFQTGWSKKSPREDSEGLKLECQNQSLKDVRA